MSSLWEHKLPRVGDMGQSYQMTKFVQYHGINNLRPESLQKIISSGYWHNLIRPW